MRLKWANWQVYQQLTGCTLQQVDRKITQILLQCGYSWSPSLSPKHPILLTPTGVCRTDTSLLEKLGFEFEKEEDTIAPSSDNAFNYAGMLSSAWASVGNIHAKVEKKVEVEPQAEEVQDADKPMSVSDFVTNLK